uniref:ATP-binding protein n=1 Tax=Ndongobacter massiliensis TaxID=1871025 RepID=UPI0009316F24|nr:hypothetical protein [Ndongobacter massiliensis]
MEKVSVRIPSKAAYVSTLRLVTSSLANAQGFDVEAVDDWRVCVSEAVNPLIAKNEVLDVDFILSPGALRIEIRAQQLSEEAEEVPEKDLHRLILDSLLDSYIEEGDCIILEKKRLP